MSKSFPRSKRLRNIAINEKGILNSCNTLHDPIHSSIIKIHGYENCLQEVPIHPIISLGHVNLKGPKTLFPAPFLT